MGRHTSHSGEDLGIGNALSGQAQDRLINRDGSFNVLRSRRSARELFSYSTFLHMSSGSFLLFVVFLFVALNLVFAYGYLLFGAGALADSGPDPQVSTFWRAFFFSVHTFTTIGYGNVVPIGARANTLVAVESFAGLFGFSLVTGLLFARFARAAVRIRFSQNGVMRLDGDPALLIRLTNVARSEIIQVEASLTAAYFEKGQPSIRRYTALALERNSISFLPLGWTLVHRVTPDSLFFGLSREQFQALKGEIILQVSGVDQTSAQTIHARISYVASEVIWNGKFADIYRRDKGTGLLDIDLSRFDEVEVLD